MNLTFSMFMCFFLVGIVTAVQTSTASSTATTKTTIKTTKTTTIRTRTQKPGFIANIAPIPTQCPRFAPSPAMQNFDPVKFQGQWFQQQFLFLNESSFKYCTSMNYTYNANSQQIYLDVTAYSQLVGGPRFISRSVGQFNRSLYNPNEFLVIQKNMNYQNKTAYNFWSLLNVVLDTDYVNYALVYTCLWEPALFNASIWMQGNYGWMYTRNRTASPTHIQKMALTAYFAKNINPLSPVKTLGVFPNIVTQQAGCEH